MKHHNNIALVTGGTSGLGAAICKQLVLDGFDVIANYLPALQQQAELWQATMRADGLAIDIVGADVTDVEQCALMAATIIDTRGPVTALINNAGITRDATLKNLQHAQWQAVINTNLGSLYNVCKPFLDSMLTAGSGRIVNISSVNAQRGQFGQTNYSAAKAGVHGFTKALAHETARKGITVNTISPGFIDTDMVKGIPDGMREEIITSIPVGRIGLPHDIARAVSFLVHEDAGYITGTELSVNGGIFMH